MKIDRRAGAIAVIVAAIAISASGCSSPSSKVEVAKSEGVASKAELLGGGSASGRFCVTVENSLDGVADPLCLDAGESIDDLSAKQHFSGFFNDSIDRASNDTGTEYCGYPDAFYKGLPIKLIRQGLQASWDGDGISSIQPCPADVLKLVNDAVRIE
ncbi:hypothetical protein [Streptomyces cyaneofuscatus]|uniref:hypothetical protein n=1 Tax=Streptomyces cyaneofuscatus TaxID=66883 RepID=UPI0033A5082C